MNVAKFNRVVRYVVDCLELDDGNLQFNFLLSTREELARFRHVFGAAFGANQNRIDELREILKVLGTPPVTVTTGVLTVCNGHIRDKDGLADHLMAAYGNERTDPLHNLSAAAKVWQQTLTVVGQKIRAINQVQLEYNELTDLINEAQNLAVDSTVRQDTQGVNQQERDQLSLKLSDQKDFLWRALTTYLDMNTFDG